jgi:2-desacetyl-2-hydroxyethyl bacteriochlorophyllide A dehydrogenase
MKQVSLDAPGKFTDREAACPVPETDHALIRVEKVGVCGSDFHAYAGRHPVYTYPRIIGHELSGIVAEVPPGTDGIAIGDRCAIEPYVTCGTCRACRQGRNNCCENLSILGIHVDGGMQEYLSVPWKLLHRSSRLSLDQLALVETLGIGAHAVDRSALRPGEDAMVVGAGPIGIAVAQFAAARGAQVHIVEKAEWRRFFVDRMGFTSTPSPQGRQADIVFDATGSAVAMAESLNHVATGGRLVFVGLTREAVCLDDAQFHRKEVTLLASRNSFGLFPRIIRMMEEGVIDTSTWITHRLKLGEVAAKFATLPGQVGLIKAIVDMT